MVTKQGQAYSGEISLTELQEWLLSSFSQPQNEMFLYAQHSLRRSEAGVLITAAPPPEFAVSDWEQGQVFNRQFELRWQTRGTSAGILLLTEEPLSDLISAALCLWQRSATTYQTRPTQHLLTGLLYWPEQGDWFFAEAAIPRTFRYPVNVRRPTAGQTASAILRGFDYRQGGRIVLTRFTHFETHHEARRGR